MTLSEIQLLKLHQEVLIGMYGPNARISDDEWNHAFGVLVNILVEMEKMGFVDLEGYDFGKAENL